MFVCIALCWLSGNDSNPGTLSSPLLTLGQALRLIRFTRPVDGPISDLAAWPAIVNFRKGIYPFKHTLVMGPRDSYITLQAYNGMYAEESPCEKPIQRNLHLNRCQKGKARESVLVIFMYFCVRIRTHSVLRRRSCAIRRCGSVQFALL
jgi:hypothetical protein